MSYILDALKKSDRERQQEATPLHLQSLHGAPPSFKGMSVSRRSLWPWLLFSGLLIFGSLWKWSDWNRQEPEWRAAPSLTLAVPETGHPLGSMNILPERFGDWYQQLPKGDISLPSPGSPQPDEVERKAVDPAFSPGVAKISATRSKKMSEPIRIKRDRVKNFLSPQSEATVIGQSLPVTPEKPEKPVKAENSLPYLQNLPPQVQAEIPKMQFAGHAYALTPSQRMIIINGTIMREGDRIDAMTSLAEITWEGVIIDRNGVRFQVKCI